MNVVAMLVVAVIIFIVFTVFIVVIVVRRQRDLFFFFVIVIEAAAGLVVFAFGIFKVVIVVGCGCMKLDRLVEHHRCFVLSLRTALVLSSSTMQRKMQLHPGTRF